MLLGMKIAGHDIGVCSWSLGCQSVAELIEALGQLGLEHVQLALGPLLGLEETRRREELQLLAQAKITLTAGMISFPGEDYATLTTIRETGGFVSDEQWEARKQRLGEAARLAGELKMRLLSTHVGFIPPSNQPGYSVMLERVSAAAAMLEAEGVELLMETGQERASELLQFLNDLSVRNVGVNFDPANMLLYGVGDPIEAVGILGRHIRHVHVKDARISERPGVTWGSEVAFGAGQVEPKAFLETLKEIEYRGALTIEREAGPQRMTDIRRAIEVLRNAAGGEG